MVKSIFKMLIMLIILMIGKGEDIKMPNDDNEVDVED